jgi:hypothetical protein
MKNRLYLFLLFGILLIGICQAEIQTLGSVKLNDCITLVQSCGSCTYSSITAVTYPNKTMFKVDYSMTNDDTMYNYTFCGNYELGQMIIDGKADVDGVITPWAYDYNVTPSGTETTGWKITIEIFASLSTLFLMVIFLILSIYGTKSKMGDGEENGSIKFFFIGISLIFLVAHILITNVVIHDTLGVGKLSSSYTAIMYVFFTVLILIFLYILTKLIFWEVDVFKRKAGLK